MPPTAFTPGAGGGTLAKPKPEESKPDLPWYYAIFYPVPTPESSDDADSADGADSTGGADSTAQETAPKEQSSGQESSSDSDEQSDTGSDKSKKKSKPKKPASSQPPAADNPPDFESSPEDEASAEEALPGAEEGQEDDYVPGLVVGIGHNRLLQYSNLDVIRVKQILEARLLTADRIIATSDSFETACERLFAFPEDVGGVGVIRRAWRLCQGGGGGSVGSSNGERNDAEETFTLDDVRPFTEIDVANAALDEGEAERYELMLEAVFEFDIEWGAKDANRLTQLQNLAKANIHIVNYLDHVIETKQNQDPNITGLSIYRRSFSQTDTGPLKVYLGADSVLVEVFDLEGEDAKDAKYLGNVPLEASASGEELEKIYLGSDVNIATIAHELMHVLDRNTGITRDIRNSWTGNTNVPLDTHIHKYVIKGFAAKQTAHDEIWADIGMTAVLDPSVSRVSKPYEVFSVKDTFVKLDDGRIDWLYLKRLKIQETFDCRSIVGACEFRAVGWKDTGNADEVKSYMIDLFWEKLVLQNGETTDE